MHSSFFRLGDLLGSLWSSGGATASAADFSVVHSESATRDFGGSLEPIIGRCDNSIEAWLYMQETLLYHFIIFKSFYLPSVVTHSEVVHERGRQWGVLVHMCVGQESHFARRHKLGASFIHVIVITTIALGTSMTEPKPKSTTFR